MRKRSKKRIPQDERPWARVIVRDDEDINIFNKISSHGRNGNRRYSQNSILNIKRTTKCANIIMSSLFHDRGLLTEKFNRNGEVFHQKLFHKYYFSKFLNINSASNFCLFLGKNSTYNRKLFISRQTVRKLMKTGMISGLQK